MNKLTISTLFLLILIISTNVQAAEFCVTNTGELVQALNTAESNTQNDHIKIAQGTYLAVNPGFEFISFESNDLEISGGWSEFFKNPCGQQLTGTAFDTVLDGDSLYRVMKIRLSDNSNLKISSLTFDNGSRPANFELGAGLEIIELGFDGGNISFDKVAFVNNTAYESGALHIMGFNRIILSNSLFLLNNNTSSNGSSFTVSINQDEKVGSYITNNTFINNSGGVSVRVVGTSKTMIANNIIYENGTGLDLWIVGIGSQYLIHNDIGSFSGANIVSQFGNLSLPPLFDGGFLNYTPSINSPLIDAGFEPTYTLPPYPFEINWFIGTTDLLGNERKIGGQVDIGAYEHLYEDLIFRNGFD